MDELRQMQLMLTDMLKVFHDFCQDNSLNYYAIAGTALGAARHHGFIPWDDDIDLAMPRPDYEKLISIFNKSNDRYVLEAPESDDLNYPYPFVKIYDTETTMIERTRKPIKRGIFIDVFPLDGAGNRLNCSQKLIKEINWYAMIQKLMTVDPNDQKERKVWKTITLKLTYGALSHLYDYKKIRRILDKKSRTFDYDSSIYVTIYPTGIGKRLLQKKSIYGVPTLKRFENIEIYCPEETEKYLENAYGDWMKLPPEKARKTHHTFYLDLAKSYLG